MDTWENDIKRYRSGEMTPQEQQAFEKRALNDPFLAEALEGFDTISDADLSSDLKTITDKISNRTSKTIIKGNPWIWPLRIAASITVILVAYLLTNTLLNKEDKQIAQQLEQRSEPELSMTDTAKSSEGLIAETETGAGEKLPTESRSDQKSGALQVSPATILEEAEIADAAPEETEVSQKVIEVIAESPVIATQQPAAPRLESAQPQRAKTMQQQLSLENQIIKGKVLMAEDDTPLPGVNIVVKGTMQGTVTDIHGNYQLTTTEENPTLVYSFIGFQTQEVQTHDQPELNIKLQSDAAQLSEVVVTGYSPRTADPNYEPVIKLATPEGGLRAYDKYLKNSLRYPQAALENKVKGRVTVLFTVRTDGSLEEFNVVKGLGHGCDEEVIRLVKAGPKWSPTTQDDVPVESEVKVRVKFALPD